MDASERSQLSAIALLIVRATLWLLPGFFSRHFIEGCGLPTRLMLIIHCRDSFPGTSLRAVVVRVIVVCAELLPGFFSRHFIEGRFQSLTARKYRHIAGILFPALH